MSDLYLIQVDYYNPETHVLDKTIYYEMESTFYKMDSTLDGLADYCVNNIITDPDNITSLEFILPLGHETSNPITNHKRFIHFKLEPHRKPLFVGSSATINVQPSQMSIQQNKILFYKNDNNNATITTTTTNDTLHSIQEEETISILEIQEDTVPETIQEATIHDEVKHYEQSLPTIQDLDEKSFLLQEQLILKQQQQPELEQLELESNKLDQCLLKITTFDDVNLSQKTYFYNFYLTDASFFRQDQWINEIKLKLKNKEYELANQCIIPMQCHEWKSYEITLQDNPLVYKSCTMSSIQELKENYNIVYHLYLPHQRQIDFESCINFYLQHDTYVYKKSKTLVPTKYNQLHINWIEQWYDKCIQRFPKLDMSINMVLPKFTQPFITSLMSFFVLELLWNASNFNPATSMCIEEEILYLFFYEIMMCNDVGDRVEYIEDIFKIIQEIISFYYQQQQQRHPEKELMQNVNAVFQDYLQKWKQQILQNKVPVFIDDKQNKYYIFKKVIN